jgi:hypothetical protein
MTWNTRWRKEFEVGYGKPPRATRYKPGQSGNSKGRPKRSKNGKTILLEALNETVVVSENGVQKRMTKLELLIRTAIARASKDSKTALNFLKVIEEHGLLADNDKEGVMRIVLVNPNGPRPGSEKIEQTRILKLRPFRTGSGA